MLLQGMTVTEDRKASVDFTDVAGSEVGSWELQPTAANTIVADIAKAKIVFKYCFMIIICSLKYNFFSFLLL